MRHNIKIDSKYYDLLLDGSKTFELRFNDRDYKQYDRLIVFEYHNNEMTGRRLRCDIGFVLSDYQGLSNGYVIFSIEHCVSLMDLPKQSD